MRKQTSFYNPDGNLVYRKTFAPWGINDIYANSDSFSYEYNEKNMLARQIGTDLVKDSSSSIEYIYDANNNLVERISYGLRGEKIFRKLFLYDNEGHKTEVQDYDLGRLGLKKCPDHVWKYNKIGDNSEVLNNGNDCNVFSKDSNVFDDNHNVIEGIGYRLDMKYYLRFTYKYDNAGNNIERVNYDENNRLISKSIDKYDGDHNILEDRFYESSDTIHPKMIYKYKYDFDKEGNYIARYWVESTGQLTLDVKREITYYP
jgi:hypothetical protein